MADTATTHHEEVMSEKVLWSGGKSPMGSSYGKLMMWYFLLSDAFTFAGFLISYGALRASVPTWPVPDFVFSTFPGGIHNAPLLFVSVMTFILLFSSYTMVRAVQEGKRENKKGVVFWMLLTIAGGASFLGCQAWEWNTLIAKEHVTLNTNPFGSHIDSGVYLNTDGQPATLEDGSLETFEVGDSYLMHNAHSASHGEEHAGPHYEHPGDYPEALVDNEGFIHRKYQVTSGPNEGEVKYEDFGPRAFGALFFFITGFHGFHVLSGVLFLIIIMLNAYSGIYEARKNGYEMVEKIGLYWHFVDLVWVFVFLVFYLI